MKDENVSKRVNALYSLVKETSQLQIQVTKSLINSLETRLDKLIAFAQTAEDNYYSKVAFFGRFLLVGFIGDGEVKSVPGPGASSGE